MTNKNKIRILLISALVIFAFGARPFLYLFFGYGTKVFSDPKEVYMLSLSDDYDEGNAEKYFLSTYGEEGYEHFLLDVLEENMDMRVLADIAEYSNENKLCDFLPYLEERRKFLRSLPSDTTWTIYFSNGYGRIYGNDSTSVSRTAFRKALEELEGKCPSNAESLK